MVDWLLRPADAVGWPGHARSDGVQHQTLTRRQALQAGDRAKVLWVRGYFHDIASFAAPPGTASEGGIDYVLGLPMARGQVRRPEAPCIARVESGTPPAHEKGRSGQVNRAARALRTSWQLIKKIA